MNAITPAFVTNHEIDALLGGGRSGERRRQRLQEQGRLPAPQWIRRIDRFRIAVYPVFALAGLLDSLVEAGDARDRLTAVSARVLGTSAYDDLAEALRYAAHALLEERGSGHWEFGVVAQRLGQLAEPVVVEWEAVVREATGQLAPWGVLVSADFGHIEKEDSIYVVSLAGRPAESFNRSHVAAGLHVGSQVGVEHLKVRGQGLDFVMPALQLHTAAAPELDWSAITTADWEEALTRTRQAASSSSFDAAAYWHEQETEPSPQFRLPAGVPTGRQAAQRLLARH